MANALDLQTALTRLVGTPAPPGRRLDAARPALGVAAIAGVAAISARGGGLVETDYAPRELHPAETLWSADGLFSISFSPIKKIDLVDEHGNAVPLRLARP